MVAVAEPRSSRERMFFTVSLFVFGICSIWSSTVLLAKIYPALFPGRELASDIRPIGAISSGIGSLPVVSAAQLPSTNVESAFNRRINVLVMGVDKRPGDQDLDRYRTDTIMVATVDPLTKQASILSIPRDALITIHHPGGFTYEDKINSSYGIGVEAGKSFSAGAKQLEADIKANFAIDIDYWVLLDFKGVEKLINVLGGIEIDIPPDLAVPDWWYSDEGSPARWVSYPAGKQHLDGYNAVAFGRNRETLRGDLDRVRRQQLVLQTAVNKVFGQKLLDDPVGLYNAYVNVIKTDLPQSRVLPFGLLAKETGGNLASYSLAIEDWKNGQPSYTYAQHQIGGAVVILKPEAVQDILATMFTKSTYARSSVEIQDGIGGNEGEEKSNALGRYLRFTKALPTVYASGIVAPQNETTITVYNQDWMNMAEDIAKWLNVPITNIRTASKPPGSALPDVVITVGKGFKVPG